MLMVAESIQRTRPRLAIWHGRRASSPTFRDIVAILLFGLVAEIIVDPTVNFPSNDDWVYALAVKEILRTGIYAMPVPSLTNLVLQAYWGALFCLPFGFSFVALRISTLVLGAVGVAATYGLCKEAGTSRGIARIAALTLALDPIYFHLANSFMTDVPHVAMMAVSLWALARGIRRGDNRWIGFAMVAALATILVRQFAIVLVVGLSVAWAAERRWSIRSVAILVLLATAGATEHLLFQYWLVHSGRTPHTIVTITRDIFPALNAKFILFLTVHGVALLQYVGLMLSPIYLAMGFSSSRQTAKARPGLAIAVLIPVLLEGAMVSAVSPHALPHYGNNLQPYGLGPLELRDTILSIHQPSVPVYLAIGWIFAKILSVVVSAAVVLDVIELGRRAASALWYRRALAWELALPLVLIVGYGSGVMLMTTAHGAFDRYLLSLILPLAMVPIGLSDAKIAGPRWGIAAAVVLGIFAVFSITAEHDYLAFQRARLAATDGLRAVGIPARDIEGGYEFDGFWSGSADYQLAPGSTAWWHRKFPYVITTGPLPGYSVDASYGYRRWLTGEASTVMVVKRAGDAY